MQLKPTPIIYIFCPANFATGGPEALHQLGQCLITLGYTVYMHYFSVGIKGTVHETYLKYNVPFTDHVINHENNILVLPETSLDPIFESAYSKTNKIIWWLSVTNYFIIVKNLKDNAQRKKFYKLKSFLFPNKYKPIATLEVLKTKKIKHIAHSYFSLDFLKKNEMDIIGKFSDYMNSAFYDGIDSHVEKEDIIIYNPKKNGAFLDEIIKINGHLKWVALIDMSPQEVSSWMRRSKLYIDFGYHPGQERMPREAILMGCCVITGKQGSAAFDEDVPLPKGYKFDEAIATPMQISEQIAKSLSHFEEESKLFENYRIQIIAEKDNFRNDIAKVFHQLIQPN